ncbi:hypothetical protein [Mesorhizobium loti]|uniref:hypothetical protein n=1 Tax=Rhizobium loti TaxID=381 RepID=UPI000478AB1D|nr:hypothetical protein [Mesorhizobium loti]
MRILKAFVGIATLFVFVAAANAEDETLGGADAIKAIVGNTIIIAGLPTGTIVLFVGADHTIDGFKVRDKDRHSDTWSEKDKKFCLKEEPKCADVLVTGTIGIMNWGDQPYQFSIDQGNTVDAHMADQ